MIAVLKPTYLCNLRCTYCYLPESQKVKLHRWSLSFAKKVIDNLFAYINKQQQSLTIIWHGGEPLLWGETNFKSILEYISQLKDQTECKIRNIIQTNLTLINDTYLEIFSKHDVKVSFSIDGPLHINDKTRLNCDGQGTYNTILRKIELCKSHNTKLSCVVVGNKNHIGHIKDLYSWISRLGISNFKFNPIFNNGEHSFDSIGISADEYADMLIELFELWFNDYDSTFSESNLTEICSNIATRRPRACHFKSNCQEIVIAISPEGEVCPCGRFCEDSDKYSYGNLNKSSLDNILQKRDKTPLFNRSYILQNNECFDCNFWDICHGGCPHDALSSKNDFLKSTFLCPAYKRIFTHVTYRLKESGLIDNY